MFGTRFAMRNHTAEDSEIVMFVIIQDAYVDAAIEQ